MIETIALSVLAVPLAVYLFGVLLVGYVWLSEGHPWSHIIYAPLILAWPYYFIRRAR